MRPEGTAGAARSFIEHGIYNNPQPTRLFYIGPMFRYENTQKGRQRQFHQFGVEMYGSYSPALDAEVISVAAQLLKRLGIDVYKRQSPDDSKNLTDALTEGIKKNSVLMIDLS